MGFFDDYLNPFSSTNKAFTGEDLGGQLLGKEVSTMFADPLDLFGHRSKETAENLSGIQKQSAADTIASQQEMMDTTNAMYDPYRQAATGAWGDYTGMTTGGDANMAPMSPQYQMEVGRGGAAIDRGMAARGNLGSSGRDAAYSDMLMSAGQGEAQRQYGYGLDVQQLGTGALGGMGAAGRQAGANVGAAYGNLGQNINSIYQNQGAQQQNAMNQGANALYGFGNYMGAK